MNLLYLSLFVFLLIVIYLDAPKPIKAICVVHPTTFLQEGEGVIYLEEDNGSTLIYGEIKGLTPGLHGFHIHRTGNLTEGCKSLCSHYNPFNQTHGGPNDDVRHVGDLGNILADETGVARFKIRDNLIKIRDVVGRSIVVHKDPDDLGKGGDEESLKTGNAGARVACGIIGIR